MREVVLDTETTGLSVKDGHRIVEIGCIELENYMPTTKRFHCYLNPGRKVSEKALEVHGYTDEFLSNKKKFSDVVDDFLSFIEEKKLIIHNAEFDLSHLNNELELLGLKKIIKNLSQQKDVTVLVSSHDLQDVTEVSERIVLLEKGLIIKDIKKTQKTLKDLESYFNKE